MGALRLLSEAALELVLVIAVNKILCWRLARHAQKEDQ